MSTTLPLSLLESVFNHLVLPPRLPGAQDRSVHHIEQTLTTQVLEASCTIRDLTTSEISNVWDQIRRILITCRAVNNGSKLSKASLLTEFRSLEYKNLLILHVTEQNAALLIRKHRE
jgi:hypothetical protein